MMTDAYLDDLVFVYMSSMDGGKVGLPVEREVLPLDESGCQDAHRYQKHQAASHIPPSLSREMVQSIGLEDGSGCNAAKVSIHALHSVSCGKSPEYFS
jgi:hypothetical protein